MTSIGALDIRHAAQRLGGEVRGRNQIICPGPGHSHNDRSLSVKLHYGAPDGFVVHSFAGDDPIVCRDHVRERLGLSAWQPSRRSYGTHRDKQTDGEPQPMTAEELERIERAVALWNEAAVPRGTAVEDYLFSRCLDLAPDLAGNVLRFHPRTPWRNENTGKSEFIPCMLAAFRSFRDDTITAVHRIRVDQPERWPKTERRMLGIVTGAAVKLAAPRSGELVIAEGVETALAAMKLGIGPTWALGSAGQLNFLPVIPGVRHLILAEETDETSRAAVKLCARRWRRAGRKTSIVSSEFGNDLNDAVIELARAATQ